MVKKPVTKHTTTIPTNCEALVLWPLVDQTPRWIMLGDVAQMIKYWKWDEVGKVLRRCVKAGWVKRQNDDEYQITQEGMIAFKRWQNNSLHGIMMILAIATS